MQSAAETGRMEGYAVPDMVGDHYAHARHQQRQRFLER